MQLIEKVASDEIIEQAFLWLCLKRKEHSPNNVMSGILEDISRQLSPTFSNSYWLEPPNSVPNRKSGLRLTL